MAEPELEAKSLSTVDDDASDFAGAGGATGTAGVDDTDTGTGTGTGIDSSEADAGFDSCADSDEDNTFGVEESGDDSIGSPCVTRRGSADFRHG